MLGMVCGLLPVLICLGNARKEDLPQELPAELLPACHQYLLGFLLSHYIRRVVSRAVLEVKVLVDDGTGSLSS